MPVGGDLVRIGKYRLGLVCIGNQRLFTASLSWQVIFLDFLYIQGAFTEK
jgi:hypothetical protein